MARTITLPCKLSIPHNIVRYPDREINVMAVFGAKSGKLLRVDHDYDGELPKLKLGENLKPSSKYLSYDYIDSEWMAHAPCRNYEYFRHLKDALEYLDRVKSTPNDWLDKAIAYSSYLEVEVLKA